MTNEERAERITKESQEAAKKWLELWNVKYDDEMLTSLAWSIERVTSDAIEEAVAEYHQMFLDLRESLRDEINRTSEVERQLVEARLANDCKSGTATCKRDEEEGAPCYMHYADATQTHLENSQRQFAEERAHADALAKLLKWMRQEIVNVVHEGEGDDDSFTPAHPCDYIHRPDLGDCHYHRNWFNAQELLAAHEARRKTE